jgi:MYXO-CTERM domain-containing protein
VGYTDTVGSASDNQVLSQHRAKEIAQYFKDKGAWCSIYYAGMGERGLAVKTDDQVDEVRNRRALYLLMPDPQKPAAGGKIPGNWKKLTGNSPRMLNELPELPESYHEFKRKQREERERKFGGGSGGGDGGTSGGDGDSDEWGKPKGEAGGAGGGDDQFVGPEPIEGDDAGSATGKGCSIDGRTAPTGALGVAVLLGLMGLRRRRPSA